MRVQWFHHQVATHLGLWDHTGCHKPSHCHCLIKSSSVKLVPSQVRSGFVRSGKSSLTNTNLKLSESSNAGHVDDDGDDSDYEDDDDHDDDDDDDVESQLLTVK